MGQQQRQKLMLGALAVLALGAGSWYFFGGSDGPKAGAFTEGTSGRRGVVQKEEAKTEQRRAKPKEAATVETGGRREREAPEETAGGRREKARGGDKREKKKEIKPAA